jgi:hypothetical protein
MDLKFDVQRPTRHGWKELKAMHKGITKGSWKATRKAIRRELVRARNFARGE